MKINQGVVWKMDENIKLLIEVVEERITFRNFLLDCHQPTPLQQQELEKEIDMLKSALDKVKQKFG